MRRLFLLALLFAAACDRGAAPTTPAAPPAPQPGAAVPPAPTVPGDAPLPGEEEIPAFLQPARAAPQAIAPPVPVEVVLDDRGVEELALDEPPSREPTLAELMQHVRVEDESAPADEGESWAFISGGDGPDGEREAVDAAPSSTPPTRPASEPAPAQRSAPEAAFAEPTDRCAPLRRLLERRREYLRRVAAERDAFGYVESSEDAAALRLLQGLRRCAEHPDDEDCRPRPLEVDVSELEPPAHLVHRQPSELDAEGKHPDEIPHDPVVLDLMHQLRACEKETVAQPLLQPGAPR